MPIPAKQRGLIFMTWGVLMIGVQWFRHPAAGAPAPTLQYRILSFAIPVLVFIFGFYRYRSAPKGE